MNKFEKQLEKWNRGVLRGAQAQLAKALGVSTATTALWATGKRRPSKGYVEQMARLFDMDAFDVYKLFDRYSVIYPTAVPQRAARGLREGHDEDYAYLTENRENAPADETPEQSNSVQLPFLNAVPSDCFKYDESDVLEWWSIPRRFARGAKYILRAGDAGWEQAGPEDLCLVKPCTDAPENKTVLFRTDEGKYICRRVCRKGNKTLYERPHSRIHETRRPGRPIGVVLRFITAL